MASDKPYHPEQAMLFAAACERCFGQEPACFLIQEMVEELEVSAFEVRYGDGSWGRAAKAVCGY